MKRTLRMTRIHTSLVFASLGLAGAFAQTPTTIPPIRGLSRTDLLEYRASDGTTKTATTPAEWQIRRTEALKAFQQIAGPLPGKEKRCALDVKIDEETDCGGYVQRAITYASEPGSRTTAYLCIPKTALEDK